MIKSISELGEGENFCDTCGGVGTIDETLGGISTSNPAAKCPDCSGKGYWIYSNLGIAANEKGNE